MLRIGAVLVIGLAALAAAVPGCGWPYGYEGDLPDTRVDPTLDGQDADGAVDTIDGGDPVPDAELDGGLVLAGGGVRALRGAGIASGGLVLGEAGIGTAGPLCSGSMCVSGGIQP